MAQGAKSGVQRAEYKLGGVKAQNDRLLERALDVSGEGTSGVHLAFVRRVDEQQLRSGEYVGLVLLDRVDDEGLVLEQEEDKERAVL